MLQTGSVAFLVLFQRRKNLQGAAQVYWDLGRETNAKTNHGRKKGTAWSGERGTGLHEELYVLNIILPLISYKILNKSLF